MSKENQQTVKYTDPTKLGPKDPLKIRIMRKANDLYDGEYRKNGKIIQDKNVNRWRKNDQAIIKSHDGKTYNFGVVKEEHKDEQTGYAYKRIEQPVENKKDEKPKNPTLIFEGTNDVENNIKGAIQGAIVGSNLGSVFSLPGTIGVGIVGAITGGILSITPDEKVNSAYMANQIPEQGNQAYQTLLDTLNQTQGPLYLSAHSLGGMNAQYALARLAKEKPELYKRVHADIYDAPNIYSNLTQEQKDALEKNPNNNIHVYVKENDVLGTGMGIRSYSMHDKHIGKVYFVRSEDSNHNYDDLANKDSVTILDIDDIEKLENKENKEVDDLANQIKDLENHVDSKGNVVINNQSINLNRYETSQVALSLTRIIEDFETNMINRMNKLKEDINNEISQNKKLARQIGQNLSEEEIDEIINANIYDYKNYLERLENQKRKINSLKAKLDQLVKDINKVSNGTNEYDQNIANMIKGR